MPGFEIVEVPPDLKPLFCALIKCGIRNDGMLALTFQRLIRPPESLHMLTADRTEAANAILKRVVPLEGDMAARMLSLDHGRPDPGAKWNSLSRAERKRARRLWTWAIDAGHQTARQGRPHSIDSALVIYLSRVIAEACGLSRFPFGRPLGGGIPRGPKWRALIAALPLAQSFLALTDAPAQSPRVISNHDEAIADILITARSPEFAACCRELEIGKTADHVAEYPSTFRSALTRARALRKPALRK